jgi:hypothetical protein
MDVCLMIEGREGVTWDQWVGVARIHVRPWLVRVLGMMTFSHEEETRPTDARGAERGLTWNPERHAVRSGDQALPNRRCISTVPVSATERAMKLVGASIS